jgi:hypothetical protein
MQVFKTSGDTQYGDEQAGSGDFTLADTHALDAVFKDLLEPLRSPMLCKNVGVVAAQTLSLLVREQGGGMEETIVSHVPVMRWGRRCVPGCALASLVSR